MDEFGVLVESIGFKSQSRSIPLSKLKSQPNKPNNQISPPPPPPQASSAHHQNNDFDFDFDFNKKTNQSGVMDLDAFFVGDSASAPDDIFAFNNSNGLDLLSDFANPTFKEPSPTPLSFFQSESPIDQLEAFAMNMNMNNVKISNENLGNNIFGSDDSFGPWFSKDSISRAHKSEIEDHAVLDSLFTVRNHVETKKAPSNTNHVDDFLFFEEPAPSAVEFLEIEGEPEERRRARFNQHLRTKERMAKALAEKNRRDLQAQHEQEERHSLAESMDNNIKRWAAGKVGNLRALLSSLEYVLWPECGWQPVPLTDMITSVSVKKVYHKATLCVHPDKVQQKGATVQQKYIAEKVFDLLKEAWNKFNSEELR